MHKATKHRVGGGVVALWHAAERAIHWVEQKIRLRHSIAEPYQSGRMLLTATLNDFLQTQIRHRSNATALVFEIAGFSRIEQTLNEEERHNLFAQIENRISPLLHGRETFTQLDGPRFGFALSRQSSFDLEAAIQFSSRLQHLLADPLRIGRHQIAITVTIGFAVSDRLERPTGVSLLRAAGLAQIEAARVGNRAIRSYSSRMEQRIKTRNGLHEELETAFKEQQFEAHFQPQVHLESGQITGFEALARWKHPERGLIPPAEFLLIMEQSGQIGRLGQVMLAQALAALRSWDQAGLNVPQVSINLTNVELRNPGLVDHIKFELDRFNLSPKRLVLEVLETVVSFSEDDIIIENLARLASIGCGIDLDDFGTGHASITSIRKFAINRIKIDQTFVTHIDQDTEQQNMVGAILTMADRLGLDTLAEGVETPSEREMLRAMGCQVMQGFELARPMTNEDATQWIIAQEAIYQTPEHLVRVR